MVARRSLLSPLGTAALAIQKVDSNWRFKIEIRVGKSYIAHATPSYGAYTQMVGTSNAYRACVEEYDGQGGSWTCTRWY
ncbi:hypothetical protein AB0O86_37080 [Streptomyces hirsutus]|uniref:hypothetical protein n=1 Tax=Streptomyces hirsutus TaxID=35620 RepID=UPI00344180EA